MGIFKKMGEKAAHQSEIAYLQNYREMRLVSFDKHVMQRTVGLLGVEATAVRAADAHVKLFDEGWAAFRSRGLLEEHGLKQDTQMMCISQWMDPLGPDTYKAFLAELRDRGRI